MRQRIYVRFVVGAVLVATGVVLGSAFTVQGQSNDYYRLNRQFQRPQLFYESVVLPGQEETGYFGLTFRIPHSALVFTKTPRENPRGGFVAEVEVVAEVFQGSDRVDTRVYRTDHYASSYAETQSRASDVTGGLWFQLPPGDYRYKLEVTDRNTESSGRAQQHRITIPEGSDLQVYPAVLAEAVDTTARMRIVQLYNLSGDIEYGHPATAVVPVSIPADWNHENLSIEYVLRKLPADAQRSVVERRMRDMFRPPMGVVSPDDTPEEGTVVRRETVAVGNLMPVGRVSVPSESGTELTLDYSASPEKANLFVLMLDLEGEQLTNDIYSLQARVAGDQERTAAHTTRFAVYWRNMPVSLYDLDVAIDHLSFMADRETIDWIQDGDREERFRAFWKKRDPTPETPFNQLMAEYYQRVDDAANKFRTGRSPAPDGLRSDRARVYIVNGPPASKERTIPQRGIVRETWTYADGRTFIFEASSGFDRFELVDRES